MKRTLLYAVIVLIALWIPIRKTDISNLEPIQAIGIVKDNDEYVIITDTDAIGRGDNIQQAVSDMKQKCDKIVYLDTAQFLFVSKECQTAISDISSYLKNSAKVAIWNGQGVLTDLAQYMKSHNIGVKLKDYYFGQKLQQIPY